MWTFLEALAGSGIGMAIVAFFLKSYPGSYLTEKGKNLATFEHVQKLVAQVQATEEAKAEISSKMWDRQTRWTAKKERYEALTADLATLTSLVVCYAAARRRVPGEKGDGFQRLLDHGAVVARNEKLTRLFAGGSVNRAHRAAIDAFGEVMKSIQLHSDETEFENAMKAYSEAEEAFIVAAKNDLGYPD